MTFKTLRKNLYAVATALLVSVTFAACSDDDKDNAPVVEPEDPETPWQGAWRCDWEEDDEIQFLVLDESKVTLYETTSELLADGKYEDKTTGSYRYIASDDALRITIYGETVYAAIMGSGSSMYLEIDGNLDSDGARFRRVDRSEVPTKEAGYDEDDDDDGDDETGDMLAGTSWKLTSMTGWGASDFSEYKGMQLRFGSNGKVTEWYSSSESYQGTYKLSGNSVKLDGIPFVDVWLWDFPITVSGNRMTLVYKEGHAWQTDFIFTKI